MFCDFDRGVILIYLDNSATTKNKPKEVIDAVVNAIKYFGNSSRGVHEESLSADRIIFETRKKIAKMFNVGNSRQVVFTKNATESLNIAINGLFLENDHIITSVSEHNSVLRPINYLKQRGVTVSYIDVFENGVLKLDDIPSFVKPNTKAIILTHASNVTGNITDLKKVGDFCKSNAILFVVDASQTAGAFNIDMQEMNIDVLCFTGHKSMLAPQGTGALCVREGVYIRPFIVGGSGTHSYDEFQPDKMPTRLEAGTLNAHGIAGLHASIDYILRNGMENLTKISIGLAKEFYDGVIKFPEVKVYGDFETDFRAPIVSLNISDMDSSEVSNILYEDFKISTRPGAHCAPLIHKALGTVEQGMVRFSFSHTNSIDEVRLAINAIKKIIDDRR